MADLPGKFEWLHVMLESAKRERRSVIVINSPEELGDNYAEIVHHLRLIASRGLVLKIVPPNARKWDHDN